MPIGLSGDNQSVTAGEQTAQLSLIEQRVLSQLLQMQAPTTDELRQLRNDIANELGIPVPVPGN